MGAIASVLHGRLTIYVRVAGFVLRGGFPASQGKLTASKMADAIAHRGPDDAGVWIDVRAGAALASRRLAVIDLSAAVHQPMCSHSGVTSSRSTGRATTTRTCDTGWMAGPVRRSGGSVAPTRNRCWRRPSGLDCRRRSGLRSECSPSHCGTCRSGNRGWRATGESAVSVGARRQREERAEGLPDGLREGTNWDGCNGG